MARPGPKPKVSDEELISIVANQKKPFATSEDVADEAGITRQAAHQRLERLAKDSKLRKFSPGSSVIWWMD